MTSLWRKGCDDEVFCLGRLGRAWITSHEASVHFEDSAEVNSLHFELNQVLWGASKKAVADLVTKPSDYDDARENGAGEGKGAGGLTAFEREVIAVFEDLVVLLGMPKSLGEIYGLLFASAEPQAFADIESKLKLSKGSVSQGLRALRELGAVREADGQSNGTVSPVGAGRVTRWEAAIELRVLIGTILRERLTPYLQRQDGRVESAAKALDGVESTLDEKHLSVLKSRLDKIQTWQSRARMVLPVIGKLL